MNIELLQKAIELVQNEKFAEAKGIFENLLKENPNDSNLLSLLGLYYVNIRDYEQAILTLQKACDVCETFGNVSALGFAQYEMGSFMEAVDAFEKALQYDSNPDIYNKLVNSLFEIKAYNKAITYSDKMFELYPDDTRAIACKVKALTQSGKLLEAEKLCVESLKKNTESSMLWMQLGFLKELIYSDDFQARKCYEIVEELGNHAALYNIAVCAQKQKDFDEAEEYYKKMLEYEPNDITTLTSLATCYLTQKKFEEGYDLYFKRDKSKYATFSNNFWKVGDVLEKEINIICDQGYGDNIQFIRYVTCLGDRKVNIATRNVLRKLFEKNFPKLNYVELKDLNPEVQTVFITDLPYILNLDFSKIPLSKGYLDVEPMKLDSEKTKVGLCWEAGSAGIRTMINRTINIKFFNKMLDLKNIQVYSFQVDDSLDGNEKYSDKMINLAKDFNDFYDTAKALKAMDVVVTVDTAVAHLAGALGINTYLMLPYATDWRWFEDKKYTPWYDNIKLFVQNNPISWEIPIKEIIELLEEKDEV